MDPVLSKALLVLMVGMITVFLILFLVVCTGELLIRFVNRFFPGDSKSIHPKEKVVPVFEQTKNISSKKMAAIIAAVEVATAGRGRLSHIEKVGD